MVALSANDQAASWGEVIHRKKNKESPPRLPRDRKSSISGRAHNQRQGAFYGFIHGRRLGCRAGFEFVGDGVGGIFGKSIAFPGNQYLDAVHWRASVVVNDTAGNGWECGEPIRPATAAAELKTEQRHEEGTFHKGAGLPRTQRNSTFKDSYRRKGSPKPFA